MQRVDEVCLPSADGWTSPHLNNSIEKHTLHVTNVTQKKPFHLHFELILISSICLNCASSMYGNAVSIDSVIPWRAQVPMWMFVSARVPNTVYLFLNIVWTNAAAWHFRRFVSFDGFEDKFVMDVWHIWWSMRHAGLGAQVKRGEIFIFILSIFVRRYIDSNWTIKQPKMSLCWHCRRHRHNNRPSKWIIALFIQFTFSTNTKYVNYRHRHASIFIQFTQPSAIMMI